MRGKPVWFLFFVSETESLHFSAFLCHACMLCLHACMHLVLSSLCVKYQERNFKTELEQRTSCVDDRLLIFLWERNLESC